MCVCLCRMARTPHAHLYFIDYFGGDRLKRYLLIMAFFLAVCFSFVSTSASADETPGYDLLTQDIKDTVREFIVDFRLNYPTYGSTSTSKATFYLLYKTTCSPGYCLILAPEPSYIDIDSYGRITFFYTPEDIASRNLTTEDGIYGFQLDSSANLIEYAFGDSTFSYRLSYTCGSGDYRLPSADLDAYVVASNAAFHNAEGEVFFYPTPLMDSVLRQARRQIQRILTNQTVTAPAERVKKLGVILATIVIGTVVSLVVLIRLLRKLRVFVKR